MCVCVCENDILFYLFEISWTYLLTGKWLISDDNVWWKSRLKNTTNLNFSPPTWSWSPPTPLHSRSKELNTSPLRQKQTFKFYFQFPQALSVIWIQIKLPPCLLLLYKIKMKRIFWLQRQCRVLSIFLENHSSIESVDVTIPACDGHAVIWFTARESKMAESRETVLELAFFFN